MHIRLTFKCRRATYKQKLSFKACTALEHIFYVPGYLTNIAHSAYGSLISLFDYFIYDIFPVSAVVGKIWPVNSSISWSHYISMQLRCRWIIQQISTEGCFIFSHFWCPHLTLLYFIVHQITRGLMVRHNKRLLYYNSNSQLSSHRTDDPFKGPICIIHFASSLPRNEKKSIFFFAGLCHFTENMC